MALNVLPALHIVMVLSHMSGREASKDIIAYDKLLLEPLTIKVLYNIPKSPQPRKSMELTMVKEHFSTSFVIVTNANLFDIIVAW